MNTLTKLSSEVSSSGSSGKQYDLVKAENGGSISYTYTQGNYTTTFSKNGSSSNGNTTSIKTESSNGSCNGSSGNNGNCTVNVNGKQR
mgnify:FL=1